MQQKSYTAFISYNSKDDKWAKWLQGKLEQYSLPSVIADEKGHILRSYDKKPDKFKVFRYVSDLVAKTLNEGLSEELDRAQYLIVICSPHSAKSEWVGKEIQHFIDTGRKDKIIPFIVGGTPYSNDDSECFNPVLKAAFAPGDLLGVNVNDYGDDYWFLRKRKAVAKVVSLLLGLPGAFGYLWNRYQHRFYMQVLVRSIMALIVIAAMAAIWLFSQPFDTHIRLQELSVENKQLPPLHDAIVTMTLGNETKVDTIQSLSDEGLIPQIPHRFLGQSVKVTFTCPDYLPLDTTLTLERDVTIGVRRDVAQYGAIHFTLWNVEQEKVVPNVPITVAGIPTTSDASGRVVLDIPLSQQRTSYPLVSSYPLLDHVIIVPHTESTVICVE